MYPQLSTLVKTTILSHLDHCSHVLPGLPASAPQFILHKQPEDLFECRLGYVTQSSQVVPSHSEKKPSVPQDPAWASPAFPLSVPHSSAPAILAPHCFLGISGPLQPQDLCTCHFPCPEWSSLKYLHGSFPHFLHVLSRLFNKIFFPTHLKTSTHPNTSYPPFCLIFSP